MANSVGFHESEESLNTETKDNHRAPRSMMEELEAVDWYAQRIDAATDPELKEILAHNRDEEKEHFVMLLEWLRRRDLNFSTDPSDGNPACRSGRTDGPDDTKDTCPPDGSSALLRAAFPGTFLPFTRPKTQPDRYALQAEHHPELIDQIPFVGRGDDGRSAREDGNGEGSRCYLRRIEKSRPFSTHHRRRLLLYRLRQDVVQPPRRQTSAMIRRHTIDQRPDPRHSFPGPRRYEQLRHRAEAREPPIDLFRETLALAIIPIQRVPLVDD